MKKIQRKKQKIRKELKSEHEELIIKHLEREWLEAERASKKHELIKKAEEAGIKVAKLLLGVALVAGAITIAVAVPNVWAAFGRMGKGRRYFKTDNISQTLRQGSSHNYWRYQAIDENTCRLLLTPQGKKIAMRNALREFKLFSEPTWDGKWRVVIYDILKKHSTARDAFRQNLIRMGMRQVQESVFVYPYECTEEIIMWAELFFLRGRVEIMEANFITEREDELLKVFKLKRVKK